MVEMITRDQEEWQVIWTEPAFNDLCEIVKYISQDSEFYASTVAQKIYDTAESLTAFPFRGRVVPELGRQDIREIFSQSYRIIYKIKQDRVAILAIVHFSRDLWKLIKQRLGNA